MAGDYEYLSIRSRQEASGAGGGAAQHDEGFGAGHAPGAADVIYDAFEVFEVVYADPGERVGVAGGGERFNDLGDVCGAFDVVDLGCAGEAQFDEGFDRAAELAVVEYRLVAGDDTRGFEAIDTALGGRRGEADSTADLACGESCVDCQEVEDAVVGGVKSVTLHAHDRTARRAHEEQILRLCVESLRFTARRDLAAS
jgi:hypothetical protein